MPVFLRVLVVLCGCFVRSVSVYHVFVRSRYGCSAGPASARELTTATLHPRHASGPRLLPLAFFYATITT